MLTSPAKEQHVQDIFNSIAPKYDLMNSLMSFGIHYFWRKATINRVNVPLGGKILDACCGTGSITMDLAQRVGPGRMVIGLDFSAAMLNIARSRLKHFKFGINIDFIQANATAIPFPDNTFDCATIGYGLRNAYDPKLVLKEIKRVIKPGGKVISLEIVKPYLPIIFKEIYDCYLKFWVPLLGNILVRNKDAYKYFYNSIVSFIYQNELSNIYQELGFQSIQCSELTCGIAAIHVGTKPYL